MEPILKCQWSHLFLRNDDGYHYKNKYVFNTIFTIMIVINNWWKPPRLVYHPIQRVWTQRESLLFSDGGGGFILLPPTTLVNNKRANNHCLSGGYEIWQPTWWSMEHATIEKGISSLDIGARILLSFWSRDVSTKNPVLCTSRYITRVSSEYHRPFSCQVYAFPGDVTTVSGAGIHVLAPSKSWHKSVSRLGLGSGEANLGIVPWSKPPVTRGHRFSIHQETHTTFGRQPLLRSAAEGNSISIHSV